MAASVDAPVVDVVSSPEPLPENPVVGELIPEGLLVKPAGSLNVVIVILGWVMEVATPDPLATVPFNAGLFVGLFVSAIH